MNISPHADRDTPGLWEDLAYQQRKFFDWGGWLAVRPWTSCRTGACRRPGRRWRRPRPKRSPSSPRSITSARGRAKELFGFDYVWEVYKPEHQRRFGYYTLPIVWGDRLVARFDSKLDRTINTFVILGLWLEEEALACGLARFITFLGASKLDATAIREPLLRRRACSSQEAHASEV